MGQACECSELAQLHCLTTPLDKHGLSDCHKSSLSLSFERRQSPPEKQWATPADSWRGMPKRNLRLPVTLMRVCAYRRDFTRFSFPATFHEPRPHCSFGDWASSYPASWVSQRSEVKSGTSVPSGCWSVGVTKVRSI